MRSGVHSPEETGGKRIMFNMFMPGRTAFGPGVSSLAGERARDLGAKRVFLVSDRTLEKIGTAKRIEESLAASGLAVTSFFDVEPEPSVETVDAAAAMAADSACDAVAGLGGGSCLDVAKAVSILLTNGGSAGEYQGLGLVKNPGVPKIMIPTTAGTGSEATFTAVLVRKKDGFKGGINGEQLFADCSLLDPELTVSMPPNVTAATGMDALAHALEAYTSKQASPFSDMLAEEAISRIGRFLRVAVLSGGDMEARGEMMLAAFWGGVALANAGVTACHALSYPLGGMFGVGHGQSNALLLPHVVRFNALALPDKFARAAVLLGGRTEGMSLRDSAIHCAELVEELVGDLGIPARMRDLGAGIREEDFDAMAARAMGMGRPMANNPRPMSPKDCMHIYREAM